MVGDNKLINLTVVIHRNKGKDGSFHLIFLAGKAAVANAVSTFVEIQLRLGRLPARIPNGIPVLYIIVFSVSICWNVVITITCK